MSTTRKSAPSRSGARPAAKAARRAKPAAERRPARAAADTAATATAAAEAALPEQAPFEHSLRLLPEWQTPAAEPWIEFTRGWLEAWSLWTQATAQIYGDGWRLLTGHMPSFAPTQEQMRLLWPWAGAAEPR